MCGTVDLVRHQGNKEDEHELVLQTRLSVLVSRVIFLTEVSVRGDTKIHTEKKN